MAVEDPSWLTKTFNVAEFDVAFFRSEPPNNPSSELFEPILSAFKTTKLNVYLSK